MPSIRFFLIYIALPLFFIIFAWASVGTPKLLRRTAMLAILVPAIHLLFRIPYGSLKFTFAFIIKDIIVFAIPFLCVFLNARRFDKSLRLSRALMFWLPD